MEEHKIKKLYRSDTDRIFLGVCGGLGEYFEIDSNIIRLIFILFGLMTGGGTLVFYFLLAFLIPNRRGTGDKEIADEIKDGIHKAVELVNTDDIISYNSKNYMGIFIVIIGLILITSQIMPVGIIIWRMIWPTVIIILGVYLIIK